MVDAVDSRAHEQSEGAEAGLSGVQLASILLRSTDPDQSIDAVRQAMRILDGANPLTLLPEDKDVLVALAEYLAGITKEDPRAVLVAEKYIIAQKASGLLSSAA